MEHTHVPQMPSLPRAAVGVPHLLHFLLFQLQLLTDAKSNECLNFCSRIMAKAIFTSRVKHSIEAAISSFVLAIYLCEQSTTAFQFIVQSLTPVLKQNHLIPVS
jgi:hypothetical protein